MDLSPGKGIGPTILVVEDFADARELLERVLGKAGYRVVSREDGVEALRYLQAELDGARSLPALVITDLSMPTMNGLQLITALRHDPSLAALPIIAMSGATPMGLHLAALASPTVRGVAPGQLDARPGRSGGVVASFRKPVRDDFKALLATVERHAGKVKTGEG